MKLDKLASPTYLLNFSHQGADIMMPSRDHSVFAMHRRFSNTFSLKHKTSVRRQKGLSVYLKQ